MFVAGSPSAAENPPRDRLWRAMVGDAVAGMRPQSASRIGLHFGLEPARVRIDLDNLVRLAMAGVQDGGAIPRPTSGVDEVVATKRSALASPGLLIALDATPMAPADDNLDAELVVESGDLPREGDTDGKRHWRGHVDVAWQQPPTKHPVALDIEARTRYSLVDHLKPVIDGLEAYLGRDPRGRLEFCPADHRVIWLRIRRTTGSGPALRVRASIRPPTDWLAAAPLRPLLPQMDHDDAFLSEKPERMQNVHAWDWVYGHWLK